VLNAAHIPEGATREQQHHRRMRAADVPHEQRHRGRAAAAASMVHVKPSPLTDRTDFAPPPMDTRFGR